MEAIARYRKKMSGSNSKSGTDSFIELALNKVTIEKYGVSGETSAEMSAVLIFKDKEGPDAGILYTYDIDGLEVGDSIVKKGSQDVHYLLTEEVKRVDTSVVIRVFNVLEINVLVSSKEKTEELPVYLQSNLRNSILTTGNSGNILEMNRGVMIAPTKYKIKIDEKLIVKNFETKDESHSTWLVEGIDNVSSPYVDYIHVKKILKEPVKAQSNSTQSSNGVKPYTVLEFETENGYVKMDPIAAILERTEEMVKIQVPDKKGKFTVTVKPKGVLEVTEYVIRG